MTMIAACTAAYKNATGAIGYQDDQISDIAACLTGWVHETQNAHGWSFDSEQLRWICQMIARGMIAQHHYTHRTLTEL
jgi:hypothetical protein